MTANPKLACILFATAGYCAVAEISQADAAVIFGGASISTISAANADTATASAAVNASGMDMTTALGPLEAFAFATARIPGARANANAVATASFGNGGASGMFRNIVDLNATVTRSGGNAFAGAQGYRFHGDFELTRPANLRVNFRVDQLDPANVTYLLISGPTSRGLVISTTGTGFLTETLDRGLYRLSFESNGGGSLASSVAQHGPGQAQVTNSIHELEYVLSSVPEPSTWATALLGFWLVGGTLRRRRLSGVASATTVLC